MPCLLYTSDAADEEDSVDLGGEKHCGLCESCQHRRRGFREAGVEDPTEYEAFAQAFL